MERFLPRIWVFVMAFGLGISISAIWRIYALPAFSPPVSEFVVEPSDYTNSEMEGPSDDDRPRLATESHSCGVSAAPQVYEYPDGGRITVKCREYKSSWAATKEYLNRMKGAAIEERSVYVDDKGNEGGEQTL